MTVGRDARGLAPMPQGDVGSEIVSAQVGLDRKLDAAAFCDQRLQAPCTVPRALTRTGREHDRRLAIDREGTRAYFDPLRCRQDGGETRRSRSFRRAGGHERSLPSPEVVPRRACGLTVPLLRSARARKKTRPGRLLSRSDRGGVAIPGANNSLQIARHRSRQQSACQNPQFRRVLVAHCQVFEITIDFERQ